MSTSKALVTLLFRLADISIDGDRPWDVRVADERFYVRTLTQGSLGLGESYMSRWWCAEDVEETVYRLRRTGLHVASRSMPFNLVKLLVATVTNQQTPERSLMLADRHYNLGNDLFFGFLGKHRNYSCGYFDQTTSLDEAQALKIEQVCRALRLEQSDHLLDIGGGWGELAHHAATTYGCRVTSINIAEEQLRYARRLCEGTRAEIRRCDYRALSGTYDKVAVVAMLTHVGHRNYRQFFEIVHRCLRKGGVVLIESVGSRIPKRNCDPWIDRYMFPGGVVPSLGQIRAAVRGRFRITGMREFGAYYVPTLRAWHANLMRSWPELSDRYPESTRLMFEYFFLSVAAAFRAGHLKHWHILLERQ